MHNNTAKVTKGMCACMREAAAAAAAPRKAGPGKRVGLPLAANAEGILAEKVGQGMKNMINTHTHTHMHLPLSSSAFLCSLLLS